MLVIIILLTGVLYASNLFVQGACRVAHDDQSFLVPFLLDELLGPAEDSLLIDGLDVPTTIKTIINDCQNRTHFSEHFFDHHLVPLQDNVVQAMNQLNKIISEQFNSSIKDINIVSDLELLEDFSMISNSSRIKEQVQQIHTDLQTIKTQFDRIVSSNPVLSANFVNHSIDNFTDYVKKVLQVTTDTCPLPLATIYKADTLICHQFASSINGIWFSIFLYMFFIIFGLCICGLYIYKRSFYNMFIDDEIHTPPSYF
ncbi:unnamed protein product [Adineta steineri]|uniref:Uncharacterized protein n=1 Tax=Adineta steineri TaxID=433720 RepID=A0A818UZ03_9BILA|nr:unnamed protein product [Adineta steineri]